MREDQVKAYLKKTGANWPDVQRLIDRGHILALEFNGKRFYMRNLGLSHL
jgi:hypothetical protein